MDLEDCSPYNDDLWKLLNALYWLAMGIAMFVVGLLNHDLCNNGGAYSLEVMGGLALVIVILMGMLQCCDPDYLGCMQAAGIIAILITKIWASVTVFGKFHIFFNIQVS